MHRLAFRGGEAAGEGWVLEQVWMGKAPEGTMTVQFPAPALTSSPGQCLTTQMKSYLIQQKCRTLSTLTYSHLL